MSSTADNSGFQGNNGSGKGNPLLSCNPGSKVGAALVVGGGIAGVQAALDLADSGIKVYLLEKSPAIGGHMAQLDKTFPTNDCAMCIVSPKLVEAGRHRNIEIITNADLVALRGEAGNFTARIRRRPRYVDLDKCTACNDCAEVCPIHVPDEFNEGLALRTAIYKPYAQAVPNAYAVTKRGTSPCKVACPADTSAQGYVALIAEGRYEEALEVVKQYNPFPATVGRVCHHPCESECNRGKLDAPVAICALKRFVADWVYEHHGLEESKPLPIAPDAKRVAIVGAGPAGLTAAHFLVRMGYRVTVFEALPVPGGMMRVGIPAYRLPREVLEREINEILKLGVELKLNHPIRDINKLFEEGYEAIFLAIGAHEPQRLGIRGEDSEGVFHGVPFLRAVSLGEKVDIGQRVVVIGGGNTAVDTARTALRLGAEEVIIVYRRSRAEMPANPWEIEEAEREGVKLQLLAQPVEVIANNGHVSAVRCIRMRLGEPDESGRRRPIPIPGSEFDIPADTMIAAVAQAPEISFLDPSHGLEITRRGTFAVDPHTLATNRPGVFAGGDAAKGPGALIEAIAAGRRGALSIDRYLRGVPLLTPRELQPLPKAELSMAEIQEMVQRGEVDLRPRVEIPTAPVEVRVRDFREVELSLTEEQARAEARRCLRCGLCSECYRCVEVCKAEAIDHEQAETYQELSVGAVILAPGYRPYHPEGLAEWGLDRIPNVVTSLQFERLLSASGPTKGHITRLSPDHREPKRIAFLQCIGSRDQKHDYCSAVCCMYATKEAMLAMEHVPDVECTIFQMDMRAFSKGFDAYFRRAEKMGVRYVRCRPPALREDPRTHDVIIRYQDEEGNLGEERFDLVVLSVGLEPPADAEELAAVCGIALDERGFCHTRPFHPVETTRPGVYVCGSFAEPKDIPDSVIQAGGAAAAALALIGTERGTLVGKKVYPPEIPVSLEEEPRIGVFVCSCGSNIAGVVDVAEVTRYAASLPNVVHAENTIYTCSADSLKRIQECIAEYGLNRVVVASCTPRTHEPLFQDTIREAGLNPFLFEMANIRDQDSWVHSDDPQQATQKAKDLVRMAVAGARLLMPLHTQEMSLSHAALVIGGGVAGMTAALNLADQGFPVYLVEREEELGGRLRDIYVGQIANLSYSGDPQKLLQELVKRVNEHPNIEVLTGYQVVKSKGFVGNFQTTVARTDPDDPRQRLIEHGVTIIATGGEEYHGPAYGLGTHPRIITQSELEKLIASHVSHNTQREWRMANERTANGGFADSPIRKFANSVVMIQCVGPWDEPDNPDAPEFYCSRVCCTVALKNALKLKELNPDCQVYVLYRDMRTYGFKEAWYTEARRQGVMFIRWDDEHKPVVEVLGQGDKGTRGEGGRETGRQGGGFADSRLRVRAWDPTLREEVVLEPDYVVLSAAMVPARGSRDLAELLKFSCTLEGFYLEKHVKLQPVEFPAEGLFLAGAAHYPKFIDDAISQAQAAAARAAAILSKEVMEVGGVVAVVDQSKCTACLTCVRICPFDAVHINPQAVGVGGVVGAAEVEPAACRGCGLCAGECPAKAIQLQHYRDEQILAKTEALLVEVA